MTTDDLKTGSAPIRQRPRRARASATHDLDPVTPDAISPEVRSDRDGPVRGSLTGDTGAGAAGGRDRSGPGGRERAARDAGQGPGRAVDSKPKD